MPRETLAERKVRAGKVLDLLDQAMPDAHIELDYGTPLQLITAVILSAQCTDKRVNMVTPALFARYPDARSLADADTGELEGMIRSCGFFRSKAKSLKGMAGAVAELHGGQVPTSRAELAALPGVGPKTAGVVTVHLGGEPAFPVDTHVKRLSRRLGFTRQEDPSRIEEDLQALFPRERCVVRDLCPRIGVAKRKATVVKSARPPRAAAVVPRRPSRRGLKRKSGRRVASR